MITRKKQARNENVRARVMKPVYRCEVYVGLIRTEPGYIT
jgi:hypothetical protein